MDGAYGYIDAHLGNEATPVQFFIDGSESIQDLSRLSRAYLEVIY